MQVPSGSPDTYGRQPSPHDPRFANERSPSGWHLTPSSPVPARRYSRDAIPWLLGSQTSLHDEPNGINHTSLIGADLVPPLSSGGEASLSDVLNPPRPLHQTIDLLEAPPGTPKVKSLSRRAHLGVDDPESPRSRSPSSLKSKSSQLSISHQSYNSRNSIGRASYREHHGPPARVRTPASDKDPLRTVESGESVNFPTVIAPPSADDPTRPGEPVNIGPHLPLPNSHDPNQLEEPSGSGARFFPMSVTSVLRYDDRKTRCPSEHDYKIEGMWYRYPDKPEEVPAGWTAYCHPEGALYFVHCESKTFTEVNICDGDIHNDIEYFREFLFSELEFEIKRRSLSEFLNADQVQLVLEPKFDKHGLMCCYYFVNPSSRSLFWLDEWDGYEVFKDCTGILSPSHKGLGIQAHYCDTVHWWSEATPRSHWNLYPNFCEVTQELKDELVDMILHAACDHLTSNRSSCPLNPDELQKYLSLVERIDPERTKRHKHCVVIIGRIMHIFYRNYFLNFYGEDCARLNFDQAVHGWKYHPSRLMMIVAPLLFMAPINNVRLLHRIFVDKIASKEKWNMFVTKLNSQLQETSVLATVLLNVNVAFIPKESGAGTSAEQFLSYSSLVASMASIMLGLVFMGHSRTEARSTPFDAAKFLYGVWHTKHGLERLAIIYSLPHAFLMWGMCLFFAAFTTQWYYPKDTGTRAPAAVVMFIVFLLVAWAIWTARDRCHFWWFQPDPDQTEHKEDENDDKMVPRLDLLNRTKATLTQTLRMFKSPPGESHSMQDTLPLPDVRVQPSGIPELNFWANSRTS